MISCLMRPTKRKRPRQNAAKLICRFGMQPTLNLTLASIATINFSIATCVEAGACTVLISMFTARPLIRPPLRTVLFSFGLIHADQRGRDEAIRASDRFERGLAARARVATVAVQLEVRLNSQKDFSRATQIDAAASSFSLIPLIFCVLCAHPFSQIHQTHGNQHCQLGVGHGRRHFLARRGMHEQYVGTAPFAL